MANSVTNKLLKDMQHGMGVREAIKKEMDKKKKIFVYGETSPKIFLGGKE
jgi:hypothetical protein